MKLKSICAICCIATVATVANAQDKKFIKYKGAIKTANNPLPLAGDSEGRLYYGTFDSTRSHIRVIEDPVAAIGNANDAGTTVINLGSKFAAAGRGAQSLAFTSNNALFVGGDTASTAVGNVWKYNYAPGTPPVFTEETTFASNATSTRAGRRSGVAVISEAGNGLLAASGFNTVSAKSTLDFFNFSGTAVGTQLAVDPLYYREVQYNSVNNVIYPIRNGLGSNNMLDSYITGIDPVSGAGTHVVSTLIHDGAANGSSGNSAQNGFYYAPQNQLVTVDGPLVQTAIRPQVRVWDVLDNGTSLSLAYSISGISETEKFQTIADAVILNDRLYVDSFTSHSIFVFEVPPAKVNRWNNYESNK